MFSTYSYGCLYIGYSVNSRHFVFDAKVTKNCKGGHGRSRLNTKDLGFDGARDDLIENGHVAPVDVKTKGIKKDRYIRICNLVMLPIRGEMTKHAIKNISRPARNTAHDFQVRRYIINSLTPYWRELCKPILAVARFARAPPVVVWGCILIV